MFKYAVVVPANSPFDTLLRRNITCSSDSEISSSIVSIYIDFIYSPFSNVNVYSVPFIPSAKSL